MNRQPQAFGSFTRDSAIKKSFFWATTLCFLGFISLGVLYSRLPPEVPFFYSLIRGGGQLASKLWLWFLPCLSLIFLLIHLWIAKYNFNRERLLSRITATATALICLLFFIALVHILIIVL